MEEHSHKVVAVALKNRRLVQITAHRRAVDGRQHTEDPGLHHQLCGQPRLTCPAPPPTPHSIRGFLEAQGADDLHDRARSATGVLSPEANWPRGHSGFPRAPTTGRWCGTSRLTGSNHLETHPQADRPDHGRAAQSKEAASPRNCQSFVVVARQFCRGPLVGCRHNSVDLGRPSPNWSHFPR